jgi:hypothetical protein
MVTPSCPKCRRIIGGDDINVASDVAFCRSCNLAHKLSALARGTGIDPAIDLARPPKGAWHLTSGLGTVIGATHRSLGGAVAMLLIACFWNGIVSVFVALALASTLGHLGVAQPAWFSAPIMNGSPIGVGMTIFLWLFLTPFILIGLAMLAAFLSCLGGRTELRIRHSHGELFTGIGPVGLRKRFTPANVKDVRIDDEPWTDKRGHTRHKNHILVELAEGKPLKFGSALTDPRRQFLAAALRKTLLSGA